MNIIQEIKNGQFVLGRVVDNCPAYEFVLINETTIRKEPSNISDPDIIKLIDVKGGLIGVFKKILASNDMEERCVEENPIDNSCVALWGKV